MRAMTLATDGAHGLPVVDGGSAAVKYLSQRGGEVGVADDS